MTSEKTNSVESENGSIDFKIATIDFWRASKGYGFVDVDGMELDAFFHVSDLEVDEERLAEGVDVEVKIEDVGKGPRVFEMRFPATDGGRDETVYTVAEVVHASRESVDQFEKIQSDSESVYSYFEGDLTDRDEIVEQVFADGGVALLTIKPIDTVVFVDGLKKLNTERYEEVIDQYEANQSDEDDEPEVMTDGGRDDIKELSRKLRCDTRQITFVDADDDDEPELVTDGGRDVVDDGDLESLQRSAPSFENDNFELFLRDDEVYTVVNHAHEDPSEHMYNVFVAGETAIKCTCPHHLHRNADCKHMDAVEDFLASQEDDRVEWRDWQNVKKEREEEERKQAMMEAKMQMAEADSPITVGDDDSYTPEEVVVMDGGLLEEKLEDDEEEVSGSQMAADLLEYQEEQEGKSASERPRIPSKKEMAWK